MFTEDLAPFFDTAGFAQAATLDGVGVKVIFDAAYVDPFGVGTVGPRVMLPTADAANATQSSVLVIDGATYRVRSIEPDGTGVSALALELQ